ncbi:MAG: hypothetical protein ACMXYD_02990 [Candidatus Woesearchaeota archaeon]
MKTIKLVAYIALTLLLVLAQATFLGLLVILAGGYTAWRLFVLISHGISCATCQIKFAGALILFLTVLILQRPDIAYLVILLLWLDYFTKDKNETAQTSFY